MNTYKDSTECLAKLGIWNTSLNPNTILSQAVIDDDQKKKLWGKTPEDGWLSDTLNWQILRNTKFFGKPSGTYLSK